MRRTVGVVVGTLAVGVAAWLLVQHHLSAPPRPVQEQGDSSNVPAPPVPPSRHEPKSTLPPVESNLDGVLEGLVRRGELPFEVDVIARRLESDSPTVGMMKRYEDGAWPRNLFDGMDAEPRASTRSGIDGRWSLRGLGPGLFHVEAVAPDGRRGRAVIRLNAEGLPTTDTGTAGCPLVLSIEECRHVLRGVAILPDGSPWTGLVKLAFPRSHITGPAPVRPDASGRFRFEGLPAGEAEISAVVPGRRSIGGPSVLLPTEEEMRFVVGDGRSEMAGRMVAADTDRPVPGMTVRASMAGPGGIADEERPVVDQEGAFLLHVPPEVSVWLTGEAPGFAPVSRYLNADYVRTASRVEVRLHRPSNVSGRVLDAKTGKVLPGVTVGGSVVDGLDWPISSSVSDAEGRFTLRGLPSGTVYLVAQGAGWISQGLGKQVAVAAGGNAEVDVPVVAASQVRGRVVGPRGSGIPGVTVRAAELPEHFQRVQEQILRRLLGNGAFETVSDPEGAFKIPLLPPDRAWSFIAYREGVPIGFAGPYPVASGATVEADIPVADNRRLEVRVVDRDSGAPVPGAEVTWWIDLMPDVSWPAGRTVVVGADGVARIGPLPAIRISVGLADSKGFLQYSTEVPPDAAGPIVIRVSPGRRGELAIEGKVVREDGTPVAGAEWVIEGAEETPETTGTTDSLGAFRARGLTPGPWTVKAQLLRGKEPLQGRTDAQAGGRDLVVTLRPWNEVEEEENPRGPAMKALITGPDGSPIPRGKVEWRFRPKGKGGSCIIPRDIWNGESEERPPVDYVPGELLLAVSSPGDATGKPLPWANAIFGPFTVPSETVTVRMSPGRAIEGCVRNEAGAGVPGATVRADPDGEEAYLALGGETKTGPDGAFRIGNLAERDFTLHVEAWDQGYGLPAPMKVRAPSTGVDIVVRESVVIAVRTLDADDKPVAHARIRVRAMGTIRTSEVVEARSDALGVARLGGMDPGTPCSLWIDPPNDRRDLLPYRAQDWKPATADIRMEKGYALDVHVVDAAGTPVEAVVLFAPDGQPQRSGRRGTDQDGLARLPALPAGPLRLTAHLLGDLTGEVRAEVVVPTESGRATLVVDPGASLDLHIAGAPRDKTVFAYLAAAGADSFSRYSECRSGRIRFQGLRSGTRCDVYVWEEFSGRCSIVRGVRPGDSTDVFLRPGRTVSGQLLLPGGTRLESVAVLVGEMPLIKPEACAEDGYFQFRRVPEGRLRIQVVTVKDEAHATRTIETDGGDKVQVDLRDAK